MMYWRACDDVLEGVRCVLEGVRSVLEGVRCVLEGVRCVLEGVENCALYAVGTESNALCAEGGGGCVNHGAPEARCRRTTTRRLSEGAWR